jgi:hypothetical protein
MEDEDIGFDENLIRKCLENMTESPTWHGLKRALAEEGVSQDLLSKKRKIILARAKEIRKSLIKN